MDELQELKDKIVLMKDDYQRRLETASNIKKEMSDKGMTDTDKYKRIVTKAVCYKATLVGLNKLI